MRLETEFWLCLQRQSLERVWQLSASNAKTLLPPAIAPSIWVKLLKLPNAYSSDEALLLCQTAKNQWLAWIPDYGEIMLERRQFELLSE